MWPWLSGAIGNVIVMNVSFGFVWGNKKKENEINRFPFFGGSHGARTHDPHIKSVMLYQLS